MEIVQYHLYLVDLDPTVGHEMRKTRPCLVISPDEMNRNLKTVMIAPLTTRSHAYPSRPPLRFAGKSGWIVLDRIRTVDRLRLVKELGKLDARHVRAVKELLRDMLVE